MPEQKFCKDSIFFQTDEGLSSKKVRHPPGALVRRDVRIGPAGHGGGLGQEELLGSDPLLEIGLGRVKSLESAAREVEASQECA